MEIFIYIAGGVGLFLLLVVIYDLVQTKHAILRNFPVIGHFRYMLEKVGPELRQYIVTNNNEERPFSRDQRRWVYASAKKQNNYFGFGTDMDLESSTNHIIIKQSTFPANEPHPGDDDYDPKYNIACAKVMGEFRERKKAFRPESILYTSAMSYGSLSSAAVAAINKGVKIAGGLHNTGEGSIAKHHDHGGDLIWQIGTGYYGCRDKNGNFDIDMLVDRCAQHQVKAIEFKLSQGAKPGRGGVLPSAKITKEIAGIRGIPMGQDCISPSAHTAFSSADEMLDVLEAVADATGLPVGIKSAIGMMDFWDDLADLMVKDTSRGVDFIVVDGSEGGTGAAPLVFSDHVSMPFKLAFVRVFQTFKQRELNERIIFGGSGRLGFPEQALLSMALGCDMIGLARETMLAIGCIQAQQCHTGHCPTGVATQNKWLVRGLDPTDKGARLANYLITLRKEMLLLSQACGYDHPAKVTMDHFEILDSNYSSRSLQDVFGIPT